MRPAINLLVLDLDNTLYDWYQGFVPAFYDMVDAAIDILKVDRELLLDELQAVHRRHGNTEQPFSLLETESVRRLLDQSSAAKVLAPAFAAFERRQEIELKLYDGVEDTLRQIRSTGVPVVAYTDARVSNSYSRLQRFGLVDLLDGLYTPAHHYPDQVVEHRIVQLLPPADRKPSPRVLRDICDHYAVEPAYAAYVGDSLVRDVYMANSAGVVSVWAKYGAAFDRELWPQLVRVTHWTDKEVEADAKLRQQIGQVAPLYTIDHFSQLHALFSFGFRARQIG